MPIKKPIIRLVDVDEHEQVERIGLPSLMLNWITGGGIPKERITVLAGLEHSGKTTVAILAAIECAKQDKLVIYADVEGTFDLNWATKLGLPKEKRKFFKMWHPASMQQFFDGAIEIIKTHKPALIVLDSIHFLQTDEEIEKDTGASSMARHIGPINSGVKKISNIQSDGWFSENGSTHYDCNTTLIIIDKVYSNLNNMWEPVVMWGGGQLRMSASLTLWMFRAKKDDSENKKVAEKGKNEEIMTDIPTVRIKVENKKNKTAQPFRKGDLVLRLKPFVGVDVFHEMVIFGIRFGVFRDKNGDKFKGSFGNNHIYFDGKQVSTEKSGKAGLLKRFEDDIAFRNEVYEKIYRAVILEDGELEEVNFSELDEDEVILPAAEDYGEDEDES